MKENGKVCPSCRGNGGRWVNVGEDVVFETCECCHGEETILDERTREQKLDAWENGEDEWMPCPECNGKGWVYGNGSAYDPRNKIDPMISEILEWGVERGHISVTSIRRCFSLGPNRAQKIVDAIYELGICGREKGVERECAILVNREQLQVMGRSGKLGPNLSNEILFRKKICACCEGYAYIKDTRTQKQKDADATTLREMMLIRSFADLYKSEDEDFYGDGAQKQQKLEEKIDYIESVVCETPKRVGTEERESSGLSKYLEWIILSCFVLFSLQYCENGKNKEKIDNLGKKIDSIEWSIDQIEKSIEKIDDKID